MALADIDNVKLALGIAADDTSEDDLLNLLIAQVTALIEAELHRKILRANYVEYYSGTGTPFLVLAQRPVVAAGLEVREDLSGWYGTGAGFGTDTVLTYGTNYALRVDQPDGSSRAGVLARLDGVWKRPVRRPGGLVNVLTPVLGESLGSLKVTYTAGYATLPADVEFAAIMAIAKARQVLPYGQMLGSESYEERAVAFVNLWKTTGILSEAMASLRGYRNRPL